MIKCGIDGRETYTKRSKMKTTDETRPQCGESSWSFCTWSCSCAQKTVVVPQIQYIAVCDATTCSLNSECSETVEDDMQNAVQRWCGQCPCRDALAFSHQKR